MAIDAAEAIRLKMLEDGQCRQELQRFKIPAAIGTGNLADRLGSLKLPDGKAWRKLVVEWAKVMAKASDIFKEKEAARIGEIEMAIEAAKTAVLDSVGNDISIHMQSINEKIMALNVEDAGTFDSFKTECASLIDALPSDKSLGLDALGVETGMALCKQMEKTKESILLLQGAARFMVEYLNFDIHDDSLVDLCELISDPQIAVA